MPAPLSSPELPPPLGVTPVEDGAVVAVLARHAEAVELCLFDDAGGERRVPLRQRAHGIWWDRVAGLGPGTRYGFRAHGAWDPAAGHRHNPAKLLLDPYGRAVEGEVTWRPEVFGHDVDERWRHDGDTPDDRDSAPHVPRSVVLGDRFDWAGDRPPRVPWTETVVYEAHVRGLTMRHPAVPQELRGTYAALAHPALIDHLTSLGVTSLELLPVHAFTHEPHLVRQGLTNYWGYNTLGFFAPHAAYAAAPDPQGASDELKAAVRALHGAGIEVLLDVVYNHTAEQGAGSGATLSWRGLDAATYYRLDERGRDVDVTGCGNTLDLREPLVARLVLDSLRHWVTDYHVDGFRFDLAPALARGRDDAYDPDHPFHVALRTDPVLSQVKLIAEPWDVGVHGWRTGHFPPPFAEWNDRFRDPVRTFWLADSARALSSRQPGHGIRELATRLTGSADLFATADRGAIASVNYVTAHDGFTLADLTAYEQKHNEANGEDNGDGHDDNRTWNHGVEGPTDDPATQELRSRSVRNLLATVLLAAGVPMLPAGDEMGRTQRGNNNAYCQDNETSWLDWDLDGPRRALLEEARALLRLRRAHRVLSPVQFPLPDATPGRVRARWLDTDGSRLPDSAWEDPTRRTLVALLDDAHDHPDGGADAVLLALHAGPDPIELSLPACPAGQWQRAWSSHPDLAAGADGAPGWLRLAPMTLAVWAGRTG